MAAKSWVTNLSIVPHTGLLLQRDHAPSPLHFGKSQFALLSHFYCMQPCHTLGILNANISHCIILLDYVNESQMHTHVV